MKTNKLEKMLSELKREDFDFNDSYDMPKLDTDSSQRRADDGEKLKDKDHVTYSNTPRFNTVWSENKETLLFGMLASIIVIVIGLISSAEYITFAGVISFLLFAVITFITFYKYILVSVSKSQIPKDLIDRIEVLERKVQYFSSKKGGSISDEKISEIEGKVEELKVIVKTLLQSINK